MRTKKNRDTVVRVYKYAATPIGEFPEEFWRVARAMRDLWNRFVDMRDAEFERLKDEKDKEVRAEAWKEFDKKLVETIKIQEVKDMLNWECREHILDRFRRSSIQVSKAIRGWLQMKSRDESYAAPMPTVNKRYGLESILIPHRFTGGGRPVETVFKKESKAKSFTCRPFKPEVYERNTVVDKIARVSRGVFGVGGDSFPFKVIRHRLIPQNATVKQVSWSGHYIRGIGWKWFLLVTIEQLPEMSTGRLRSGTCGLDVGWRKIDENTLRIGVIYDNNGNSYEIKLPLGVNREVKNHIELGILLKQAQDSCKDKMKAECLRLGIPKVRMTNMGQRGLSNLCRELEELEERSGDQDVLMLLLKAWRIENDQFLKDINNLNMHVIGRRKWLYENIANELCRNYSTIVWEGKLDLKKLSAKIKGEKQGNEFALQAAKRYMRASSLFLFRDILKRTAEKYGTEIVDGKTEYSTVECYICHADAEASSKLKLTCPNGHLFDQDENAARNLLREVYERLDGHTLPIKFMTDKPRFWQVIQNLE